MKAKFTLLLLFVLPVYGADTGPLALVRLRLKELQRTPPLTCRTNGGMVFCTMRCRDLEERNLLYNAFRKIPNCTITATKSPPSVCVVLPADPASFERTQETMRKEAIARQTALEQEAKAGEQEAEGRTSLAWRIKKDPAAFYGVEITFEGDYAGLEPMPGDAAYELGFAVRENGGALSCVVFAQQTVDDPITQYMLAGRAEIVRSLTMGDKVRVTGKLVAPGETAGARSRRASPFFVAGSIERL